MGFLEVLTVIFIVLKLAGIIDWSWWLVWAPMYPALFVYLLLVLNLFRFMGKRRPRF